MTGRSAIRSTGPEARRTVLVTGASRGLGQATAEVFHRRGWNVVAAARDPDAIVEPLAAPGAVDADAAGAPGFMRLPLDVAEPSSATAAVKQALTRFGTLDGVVNNAGVGEIGPFEAIDEAALRRQFEVVVFGAMAVTRAALPALVAAADARGCAVIVNVSSEAGRIGYPFTSVYASAKHALEGFSEAFRYEVAPHGVRVRIVEPGRMRTAFEAQAAVSVSPEVEARYPGFSKWRRAMASERGAADPSEVAAVVYRAATSRSERLRWRAKPTFLHIARWMPDAVLARGFRFWLER